MRILMFLYIYFCFFATSISSKEINFEGFSKLSISDLQTLTDIDLSSNTFNDSQINSLIIDLVNSDLINDIEYLEQNSFFLLTIYEADLIEKIFINGNEYVKDDIIFEFISVKEGNILNNDLLLSDFNKIRNIYASQGFNEIQIKSITERYSPGKVNLIFYIDEGYRTKITNIKFLGNTTFSSKFLVSKINSEKLKFYNIFETGANFNPIILDNDTDLLIDFYKSKGFSNVEIAYEAKVNSFNKYIIYFYISENKRLFIDEIRLSLSDDLSYLNQHLDGFKKIIKKNNNYYDFNLVNDFADKLNEILIDNNILDKKIIFNLIQYEDSLLLQFENISEDVSVINKISINGNIITKEDVIRSKLSIEPGDYFNKDKTTLEVKELIRYPYINNSDFSFNTDDFKTDLSINIEENQRTGNLLVAGTVSGDRGVGASFGANDKNLFGTGNSLQSSFDFDDESISFNLNYRQYPTFNSRISNNYYLTNEENDFTSSFGYKLQEQSLRYSLNFDYTDDIIISSGIKIAKYRGHSQASNDISITDNIGTFHDVNLNFSISQDKTNDYFFPNNGYKNSLYLTISPSEISDNSYVKFDINNLFLKKLKNSENFFFLDNKLGISDSFNGKLKTINAYSLGGLNFKGFDYRGIGKKNTNNNYLGGKKIFTSTLGYGSNFLFDDKDNIYFRVFLTVGSLWDNDYLDTSFKLRSSIGTSIDFLTPVGPISLFYAIPIEKQPEDLAKNFNFAIGSSF
tara:strand:+ start:5474 stop:7699 length:2226 start_codon:yes stop_codon:yes gene_type:complete